MADESSENIGGIDVSVGATHAQMLADLAEAEAALVSRIKAMSAKAVVTISAQMQTAAGGGTGRPGAVPSQGVVFGPKATSAAQSVAAQPSFIRAVNAELAKSGQTWNATTNEIESATKATRSHQQAVLAVQQTATQPSALNIDTGAVQTDLQAVLTTLREIVATAKEVGSLPAANITAGRGSGTAAAANSSLTSRDRALNTDLATRIARAAPRGRQAEFPPQEQPRGDTLSSSTFAPALTADRRGQIEHERALAAASGPREQDQSRREENARQRQQSSTRARAGTGGGYDRATTEAFAQSERVRQFNIDEDQQARFVASRRASVTGSGRTKNTLISGVASLFGGTQGAQIEAQVQASQAARQLASAEKVIAPLDNRLRQIARTWSQSTGENRQFNRELFMSIRKGDEYQAALGKVKTAVEEDAVAQDRLNKISSGTSIARNLFAITAAGAAFSVGMKAVGVVAGAVEKGLTEFFEIQTGFGGTSTRVTTALGAQTIALHGNADAALAAAEAQAGISAASADALNAQLKLTTQIKAGAQAQQSASELFRAGFGVGNAPSGQFGSYGGVLGTGLFGQKGFSQQVQTDIRSFQQGRGGENLLGEFSTGLDYATNPAVRSSISNLALKQGNTGAALVGGALSFPQAAAALAGGDVKGALTTVASGLGVAPAPFAKTQLSQEGTAYINNLNDAAKRGAAALNETATASYRVATSQTEVDQAVKAAAAAGDQFGVTLAQQDGIVLAFGDAVAGSTSDVNKSYKAGVQQAAVGAGITDPATLAKGARAAERQREIESAASLDAIRMQQAFQLPSQLSALQREQATTAGIQQPAQYALQNLAQPLLPVGTGIAAEDQAKVAAGMKVEQGLQDELNARYKQGQQIIRDTYDPQIFKIGGAAMQSAFDGALQAVTDTGIQIAGIQAKISNKQADYQVAQYNLQLRIAKQSLSDIGGLIGKNLGAGESQIGVLERQNLQLSRQGQALQFGLSQRSINFQTALAGFQAPGVTPEERQARVAEAKIEAGYAQKQLDIQKQMFGNQVKIVDLGNLRSASNLWQQVFGPGGLTAGRKLTLDLKVLNDSLALASQKQDQNVAKVGTYFAAANGSIAIANANITALEAAAGKAYGEMTVGATKAMVNIATTVLGEFGIYFAGINGYLNAFNSAYGGGSGGGTSTGGAGGGGGGGKKHATGVVMNTTGPVQIGANGLAGEAGSESLIILSRPHSAGIGTSGGQTLVINFNGPIGVRSEADLYAIARKVSELQGREASLKGLRTGN